MASSDLLIIFTKYPLPGKTKTRLIGKLGEKKAADLQRKMTQYTLMQAKKCAHLDSYLRSNSCLLLLASLKCTITLWKSGGEQSWHVGSFSIETEASYFLAFSNQY